MKALPVLAGAILCMVSAFGHHSVAAEFDVSKTARISGTISKVEFANPHVTITLDVRGADGAVTAWRVDSASPNFLLRNGFTKEMLAKGTTITVDAYLAKDGSAKADGRTFVLADGRELRLPPWSQDFWNPFRDSSQDTCAGVPRTENCIRVEGPSVK